MTKLRATFAEFEHRAFVAPRSAWPLAIARIMIGFITVAWACSMLFDSAAFFGANSVGESHSSHIWQWIPLDSVATVRIALGVLIVAGLAVAAGWRPTIWLLVSFALLVAIQRQNTLLTNSGDIILRNLTLLLALTPTSAALSFDRVRRHGRQALWTSAQVAPWGWRLVQLQIMIVYFYAFWSKRGDLWSEGTAVSTVFRLEDMQRFGHLDVMVENIYVVAFLTWSSLVIEVALGTLLWVKRLRPALIVGGVLLHLMIDAFVLVGFFGLVMVAGLMSFVDADWIDRWMAQRATRGSEPLPADHAAGALSA